MGETIGLRTVTARTQHDCFWCIDGIQPGEKYDRWMWKDGGDVAFMQVHSICFAAVDLIRRSGDYPERDEFPCERQDHAKGHGCWECDPMNERREVGAWEKVEAP